MQIKHLIILGFSLICLYVFFWPSEKDRLNAQMAELCKKDGGVRIYEKVKLPADAFDSAELLKSKSVKEGNDYVRVLDHNYKLVEKLVTIKGGDPTKVGQGILTRSHIFIKRISDGKIVAEAIQYGRGGGDRWFAGMPSSEHCPNIPINLIELAIIKE